MVMQDDPCGPDDNGTKGVKLVERAHAHEGRDPVRIHSRTAREPGFGRPIAGVHPNRASRTMLATPRTNPAHSRAVKVSSKTNKPRSAINKTVETP